VNITQDGQHHDTGLFDSPKRKILQCSYMSNIQNCPLKPKRLPSLITFVKQHIAASSVQQRVGNRALGNGCVFGNRRVLVDLGLVVLEGSVGDRAHLAGFLLCQVRVGRREIRANRANDGAGCVGDGALVVGVLEGRAGAGVLDVGGGYIGVVVDDGVAVVLHLGVGDRATSFGVAGVVVRVVGREGGGGRSHNGANLLGGGHGWSVWLGRRLVSWVQLVCES
jgi:hypothetical protein